MSSSDNVYVNVSIDNTIYNRALQDNYLTAKYDQTSTYPILQNPSEYYLSIVRFSIPTDNIPIFFFPLDIYQTNVNVSNLEIGVETALGTSFSDLVTFVPQNKDLSPPQITILPPSPPYFTPNDTINPYYELFNIQPFLDMINDALAAAITNSALGVPAPYYIFDPKTELISLVVTQAFIATNASIFMNTLLAKYLFGFYLEFKFGYYYHNLSDIPFGSPVGGPYVFIEEFSSVDQWFDITKVVITSSSLGSTPEFNPSVSLSSQINSTSNQIPIITDFAVSFPSLREYSSTLVYNPTSQYRLIDLNTNTPISRVQFQFYWQNKHQQLIPILISPNQSIEIKLAFVKKSLYNGKVTTFK